MLCSWQIVSSGVPDAEAKAIQIMATVFDRVAMQMVVRWRVQAWGIVVLRRAWDAQSSNKCCSDVQLLDGG